MTPHQLLPRLLTCSVALFTADGLSVEAAEARRPSILFILADDLGQRDLGIYGSTFHETPRLDQLAKSGVRFTQAYTASPVCSPTRASLLTGKYPARLGITDWLPGRRSAPADRLVGPALPAHLDPTDTTIAEALQREGYQTFFIGKWHLGDGPAHLPDQRGFELNIAGSGRGSPASFFSPYRMPNLTDGPDGEHLDERLAAEAIKLMRRSTSEGRPFFIYLSHYAVHTPLQAKPELIEKYTRKLEGLDTMEPEFSTDGPDGRVRIRQRHPTYAAMVESLDTSVGMLMDELQSLGIADNTIVIFTSDNGGLATSEGWPTSNLPLRTGKGWAYEGGVRVPLFLSWPTRIPAGHTTAEVVTSPDFFPTLLELAGLPPRPDAHLDGRSFAASAQHAAASSPERAVFWHYPHYSNQRGRPHSAVRRGEWKLIEWLEDARVELYNLTDDLSETNNLADSETARAAALRTELHDWRRDVGAKMPVENPARRAAP